MYDGYAVNGHFFLALFTTNLPGLLGLDTKWLSMSKRWDLTKQRQIMYSLYPIFSIDRNAGLPCDTSWMPVKYKAYVQYGNIPGHFDIAKRNKQRRNSSSCMWTCRLYGTKGIIKRMSFETERQVYLWGPMSAVWQVSPRVERWKAVKGALV